MSDRYLKQYLEEIRAIPELTKETAEILSGQLPDASAEDALIRGSLAFVARTTMEFSGMGADPEDLIQEGNMAVTLLVRSFPGGDFFRQRETAVREAMRNFAETQKRYAAGSDEMTAAINRISDITTTLAGQLGREATLQEVAAEIGIPEDQVRFLLREAFNAVSAKDGSRNPQKSGMRDAEEI